MSIAERIADSFASTLDLNNITPTQNIILHAIKNVAVREWAVKMLKEKRGY